METETIMKEDTTYNGWKNYETWCVALWIDNDQGLSEMVREQAKELTVLKLSDWLKDYFDEINPLPDAGMFTDLLNAALSNVNWYEVASHYVEGEL